MWSINPSGFEDEKKISTHEIYYFIQGKIINKIQKKEFNYVV